MGTQVVSGGEFGSAHLADGLAAVPGHVFAAPEPVGQELSAAGHRAERAPTWRHTVSTVSGRPGTFASAGEPVPKVLLVIPSILLEGLDRG